MEKWLYYTHNLLLLLSECAIVLELSIYFMDYKSEYCVQCLLKFVQFRFIFCCTLNFVTTSCCLRLIFHTKTYYCDMWCRKKKSAVKMTDAIQMKIILTKWMQLDGILKKLCNATQLFISVLKTVMLFHLYIIFFCVMLHCLITSSSCGKQRFWGS